MLATNRCAVATLPRGLWRSSDIVSADLLLFSASATDSTGGLRLALYFACLRSTPLT